MIWQASGLRIHQSEEIYSKSSSSISLNNIERDYSSNEMDQTISNVSLQWLNKDDMKIVWSDQSEEVILITVSKQFSDLEENCIFEGSPANINSTVFSASIIGCFDSEETVVNLGVNNVILELLLFKNGTTLQNNWSESQIENNLFHSRTKRGMKLQQSHFLVASDIRSILKEYQAQKADYLSLSSIVLK